MKTELLSSCLVTNDDGDTDLLRITLDILRTFVKRLTVIIPEVNKTGCAAAITLNSPIHLEHVKDQSCNGTEWWRISTYPADGVRWSLREICPQAEMVISGINDGHNLGYSVINSGTVGAAMEAARFAKSGICLSAPYGIPNFSQQWLTDLTSVVARLLAFEELRSHGPAILNVNLPERFSTSPPSLRVLPLSRVTYDEWYERTRERGNTVLLRGQHMLLDPEVGDLEELAKGNVVINVMNTPWTLDSKLIERAAKERLSS